MNNDVPVVHEVHEVPALLTVSTGKTRPVWALASHAVVLVREGKLHVREDGQFVIDAAEERWTIAQGAQRVDIEIGRTADGGWRVRLDECFDAFFDEFPQALSLATFAEEQAIRAGATVSVEREPEGA